MLIEQETASIMKFALNNAGNVSPLYYSVPESFRYPAMYFPQPEIITSGDTVETYAMRYLWFIKIFCETTEKAHEIAWKVLTALKQNRNLVPLIDENGRSSGKLLRLDDPSVSNIDTGVSQLSVSWTSRRPYTQENSQKMKRFEVNKK